MDKVFFVLCAILFTTPSVASSDKFLQQLPVKKNNTANQKEYIAKYKDVAMEAMKTYNVLASISLAQGILESGAGTSDLALNNKNHFGIPCDLKQKKSDDCFKTYEKGTESFIEHAKMLKENKSYKRLFSHAKRNYIKWAYGLKKYGYATGKNYPKRLIFYIEKYKLYQYDDMVLAKRLRRGAKKEKYRKLTPAEKATAKKEAEVKKEKVTADSLQTIEKVILEEQNKEEITNLENKKLSDNQLDVEEVPLELRQEAVVQDSPDILKPEDTTGIIEETKEAVATEESLEMTNTTTNEEMPEAVIADENTPKPKESVFVTEYYTVQKGDTYYNIANRYGITVPYLKQLNEATSNLIIIGQQLKISGDVSDYKLHDIIKGDTLYNISNRYGVTINYLKLLNNVGEDNIIYIGHILKY